MSCTRSIIIAAKTPNRGRGLCSHRSSISRQAISMRLRSSSMARMPIYLICSPNIICASDRKTPDSTTGWVPVPLFWNHSSRACVALPREIRITGEAIAINDGNARLNALVSGSAHLINRLDPKTVGTLKENKTVQIFEISGSSHYSFAMRCDAAPFDNKDLRLALKYAVDREAIVKTVLLGHGKVGNDHPIPSFGPFYAADIPQTTYDPDMAKSHFKRSGHSGPIVLTVSDAAYIGAVDAAQIFQASAAKAGIEIRLERAPADGYWDNVWRKKPFCATFWSGRPTADLMLSVAYKSDANWNETAWKRPDFDKLLVAARSELDPAKRKPMYRELQLMIHDDGGVIIPMFNNTIDAGSGKVKGYVSDPTLQMSGYRAPEKVW